MHAQPTVMRRGFAAALAIAICFAAAFGCTAEVGSKAWCEMMDEKPKGDWTGNEAIDFTKHCLFD